MFAPLMGGLRLPRRTGRPRTRPNRLLGDKAYANRSAREYLRRLHGCPRWAGEITRTVLVLQLRESRMRSAHSIHPMKRTRAWLSFWRTSSGTTWSSC